LPTSIS